MQLNPRFTRKGTDRFPDFRKPIPVGFFSVNAQRQYDPSPINCKYVKSPANGQQRKHFDLNHGYENVCRKPESANNEKLDHLLRFIQTNWNRLLRRSVNKNEHEARLETDFVCFRGLLRQLMCTPYEDNDPWCILSTRFGGTIYLCALETDSTKRDRQSRTDNVKRILSYGFKFEQFMMAGKEQFLFIIITYLS